MLQAPIQGMAAQVASFRYGRRQVQRATRVSVKTHQRSLSVPDMRWLHRASTDGLKARRAASVPIRVVCTALSSTKTQPPVAKLQPADAGRLQTAGLKRRRIVQVVAADFRDKRTYKREATVTRQRIQATGVVHRITGKSDYKVAKRPTLAKSSRQVPGFTNRSRSAANEADGRTRDPPTALCNCHHGTKLAAFAYRRASVEATNVSLSEVLVEDATRRSRCHGYRRELRDTATKQSPTHSASPFVWSGTESENAFLAAKQSSEDSPRVSTVGGGCTWFHISFAGLVLLSASLLTFCVIYAVGNMTLNANDLAGKRIALDDANTATVVPDDDAAALARENGGSEALLDSRLRLTAAIRRSKLRYETTPSDDGTPNDEK